ncbi:MAG: helix-turn-helix domain-containing protein [Rikenellaceae bacterium]|nr:helix-turn-helix domain-containing protein [Rikenellaceae bacterium]
MEEKLRKLMKHEGINSTKLAEMLGIQASGISHIMSGRNKPSYDFIVKLLNRFPQINPDWLLIDKGPMYRDEIKGKASTTTQGVSPANVSPVPTSATSSSNSGEDLFSANGGVGGGFSLPSVAPSALERDDNDIILQKSVSGSSSETPNTQPASAVERIVFFFRNKSFAEYRPE